MNIIQFSCADPGVADTLKSKMTQVVNLFSRLAYLSSDPEYVTEPFSDDGWFQHTVDSTLYWANYDAVYNNLGDIGRALADGLLAEFIIGQEFTNYPGITLQVVNVDPVAEGYL